MVTGEGDDTKENAVRDSRQLISLQLKITIKKMKQNEAIINGYINVYNGTTWDKQWAELVYENLSLYLSKNEVKKPIFSINIKGMVIQPAVKETKHMLAFQLVEMGGTKLLMEPLDMTDMGRWISSLFVAVEGVALEQSQKQILSSEMNSNEDVRVRKHVMFNGINDDGHRGERESRLVDVKKIAQMFETMAKKTALSLRESSSALSLRRCQSSPNLLTERKVSTQEKYEDVVAVSEKRQEFSSLLHQEPTEDTKPIIVGTILKTTKEADVKSWQGPYKAQDTEKQVLNLANNPFLAKKRLTRHEKQIKKMEATIREINASVERQKNSLTETKEIISQLQNKTSGTEEQEEIIKLENDCTHLEIQIRESEGNVEHYKVLIQQIESEMTHLPSSSIQFGQVQNENLETVDSQNTEQETLETRKEPLSAQSNGEEEQIKEAPIWVKQAHEKSKKAFKILAEQGKLD